MKTFPNTTINNEIVNFKKLKFVGLAFLFTLAGACQKDDSKKNSTEKIFNDPELKAISSEQKIHAAEVLIPVKETLLIVKNLGDSSTISSSFPNTNSLISKIRSECFVVKGASPGSTRTDHQLGFNLDVYGSGEKQCPASITHVTKVIKNTDPSVNDNYDFMDHFVINSKFALNQFGTPASTYLKTMDLSNEAKAHRTSSETEVIYEKSDIFSVNVTSTYYDDYQVYYSSGFIQKSKSNSSDSIFEESSFENWTVLLPDYKAQIKSESRKISSNETQTRYFFNNKEISKTNLDNIFEEASKRVSKY